MKSLQCSLICERQLECRAWCNNFTRQRRVHWKLSQEH